MPLLIGRRASRWARWNGHRSQILATANSWVAHAHMNKPHDSIANEQKQTKNKQRIPTQFKLQYMLRLAVITTSFPPTPLLYPQRGLHCPLLVQRQIIGRRKWGDGLEVPCRFVNWKVIAAQQAGNFASKSSHRINSLLTYWNSWLFVNVYLQRGFSELNKHSSQIAAALK